MKNQQYLSEAFDSRSNSIGFLRWAFAFAVIFSHAGPIAGFYGGKDLGVQISPDQSIGGVAVAGFFFLSGFLITRSRSSGSGTVRFLWKRVLRIFPAFWLALIVTAFALAPIAFIVENGTIDGYFNSPIESPWTYVPNNALLDLNQRNIAGIGATSPFAALHEGARDWNGSAWTLIYEFRAYILVAVLGVVGLKLNRWFATFVAVAIIFINAWTWSGIGNFAVLNPLLNNPFHAMLTAPFAFGILFALWAHKIPIAWPFAVLGLGVGLMTYDLGGWNIWGQYGFLYFCMWFGIRVQALKHWEKYGDVSYGVYIYGWPILYLASIFDLQRYGWVVFHVIVVVVVHVLAFISWHVVEKRAMQLKNWTIPGPLPAWYARQVAKLPGFGAVRGPASLQGYNR